MLFIVEQGLLQVRSGEQMSTVEKVALSRLLQSSADGHHVVLIDPSICRFIESLIGIFSEDERAAAKRIRTKFADYSGLKAMVSVSATVVAAGTVPHKRGAGWEVPLPWIAQQPLAMTSLLGEDLYDAKVLRGAALDHLERLKLGAFHVRAKQLSGGGGNAHRVLTSTAINGKEICICIVDSDKFCPASPRGPTAQPCFAVTGDGLFEVEATKGRSLENSIPWRLIDLVEANRNPRPSTELADFARKQNESAWYIHMKRGACGYDISKFEQPGTKAYWKTFGIAVRGSPSCGSQDCTSTDSSNCCYRIHSGFGGGLLQTVGNWLDNNLQAGRSARYLPSPNESDWQSLGKRVAEYCLGGAIRRI